MVTQYYQVSGESALAITKVIDSSDHCDRLNHLSVKGFAVGDSEALRRNRYYGRVLPQNMVLNRTNSQTRTFRSNGDRIYFSSTSDRDNNITCTGMTSSGGMMGNGSSGGMMGNRNGSSDRMGGLH